MRYRLGAGGPGRTIDLRVEPDRAQGSWTFAEGSVHHCAFETDDFDTQARIKGHLEGMGFTDVSDVKDRGYFDSVYVRSPSGALFEATVSKPEGLMTDEAPDELGHHIIVAPQFEGIRDQIVGQMEALPAPG